MNGPTSSNPLLNREALVAAIEQCRKELRAIEDRLGTKAEVRGDLDRASEIVHRINNLNAALIAISG
jgi:hypothetical protein